MRSNYFNRLKDSRNIKMEILRTIVLLFPYDIYIRKNGEMQNDVVISMLSNDVFKVIDLRLAFRNFTLPSGILQNWRHLCYFKRLFGTKNKIECTYHSFFSIYLNV